MAAFIFNWTPRFSRLFLLSIFLFCPLLSSSPLFAQGFRYDNTLTGVNGIPRAGVTVAVCQTGLATTAAAVTNNVATLTLAGNPSTLGFIVGGYINVTGFTGADTYFNSSFVLTGVSTTALTFNLSHANGSATSNGSVAQVVGASATCAPWAAIYSNPALTLPALNPYHTDGLGNYGFAAPPGTYPLSFNGGSITPTTYTLTLPCVPNSTCPLSGSALALPVTLTGNGYSNSLAGTVSAARTWTLQDVSDTFVYLNTADTLKNKTLTSPTITSPSTTGTDSGAETLTNKSIAGSEINSGTIPSAQIPAINLAASGNGGVTSLLPHANIASTAVTPGSYTNANITVAADGSVTAAANGSGGGSSTLNKQDAQGSPTTGNGSDQTVYTYSMPGGSLAAGKCLDIYYALNWVAASNQVEAKIFFGGTQVADATTTAGGNANSILTAKVCNNSGSTTAQWYTSFTQVKPNNTQALNGTLAVNTGSAVTIYGTANVVSANTWQGMGWTVVAEP